MSANGAGLTPGLLLITLFLAKLQHVAAGGRESCRWRPNLMIYFIYIYTTALYWSIMFQGRAKCFYIFHLTVVTKNDDVMDEYLLGIFLVVRAGAAYRQCYAFTNELTIHGH